MNAKSKSSKGYAVFEGTPLACREYSLSLDEAFHSIMAHCGYEPVWQTHDQRVTLRFRYLEEPHKGGFVYDTPSGSGVMQFERALYINGQFLGAALARAWITQRVLEAGLCGWQAMRMDHFHMKRGKAEQEERERRLLVESSTFAR